ncbi:hypothetical protein A1F94_006656 [Pyrenophora tritici-repentis]|uniref:Uncharacterized protein n=1 Tax=Pyrenophora tritici-repentis TaxID=45151 RepID=A0A2W1GRU7_9PLEO|nr:hypothetical protein PtrV1_13808 [Pyrenophora tritici-repentis]KAF7447168.1 hypothetical protein A1F99_086150 [Pyrenophora tritici-repentis]KAF7569511.1 hypothetical protein PtrM4_119260 [Pyrenophora tritici-repentis]KAG9382735.1 hypothetical protein A1F94_006656 [Pyrenophora tritici-repentis]KAI0586803.1 hypothetical protein Alg215_01841 [Pyrenophora tritici-repentis]
MVDGKIVLYAHFEPVEGRSIENAYSADLMKIKDEDKMWYNGTYGDEGLKIKAYFDDTSDDHNQDPYLPTALSEAITIDVGDSRKVLETGVIIGRALPERCLDPNARPAVRAIITKIGSVVAFVPAKYVKHAISKASAQIHMDDIEYDAELEKIPFGPKRTEAIKAMIEDKIGSKQIIPTLDSRSLTISAFLTPPPNSPSTKTKLETAEKNDPRNKCSHEGSILIGQAKESWCRDPNERPLVYAQLRAGDGVVAFAPAKYAKH